MKKAVRIHHQPTTTRIIGKRKTTPDGCLNLNKEFRMLERVNMRVIQKIFYRDIFSLFIYLKNNYLNQNNNSI